ncbi:hypothetical protein EsDP_00005344 [Epichloe bromicola]|uniref:Uncharacterized protein n=1 Tax=Epichloe bromicola TaxID=79588 RepID=A0ABQ0CUD6_9HYPO
MGPKPGSGGPSGPSSEKRNAATGSANGRQKMARVHAARHIPAQPAEAALKDGQLDLQAFLKAHEFEINAMQQSMATSKAVSSSRAFQQVPRGLRRRTASHNPRRVPRRLRSKAKREMQDDNTPLVESRRRRPRTTRARIRAEHAKRLGLLAARKRRRRLQKAELSKRREGVETPANGKEATKPQPEPKIRRNLLNDPPKAPARFRKRQIHKTWLPTHKWHAKRAKMTQPTSPLWRFAIPLTPNEKIYRAAHRAQGERGTLVWDMSYMSTIGLYGNPAGIEKILKTMGVTQESCWNEKGKKWSMGSRSWSGWLSRKQDNRTRLICPATMIWNPQAAFSTDESDPSKEKRQLLIRLSPAAFLETFAELVRLCKIKGSGVFVEDLRFQIGSIELTGPASTETLLGTMTPYNTKSQPKNKHAGLFESLKTVTNPACLPANSVLGFSIQDPRLRYPPRKMEITTGPAAESDIMDLLAKWPAEEGIEPYGLFARSTRFRATCLPSQVAISKRKSLNTPGSFLKPSQVTDPPIPIILIASRCPGGLHSQGTWTLLMPWKCVPPLWHSIVHYPLVSGWNPRFAGLNEHMQVAFERGLPWFPRDFPATDAGATWEQEERDKRERQYEKRPKSKRIAFSTMDMGAGRRGEVGDGHACDFELIFGLPRRRKAEDDEEFVQADEAADNDAMDIDQQESIAQQPVNKESVQRPSPLALLNSITKTEFLTMTRIKNPAPTMIPPNTIINVRLTPLSGGTVTACARIYRLPSIPTTSPTSSDAEVPATLPPEGPKTGKLPFDLRAQWLAQMPPQQKSAPQIFKGRKKPRVKQAQSRQQRLAQELTAPPEPYPPPAPNSIDICGHPLVPGAEDLVGFVTTGSYCLRDGKAAALGNIAVEKILAGVKANGREGHLCIVRDAGKQVGWIARWELV